MLQPPDGQPVDRWKMPVTGALIAVAAVGGGAWLTRGPVSQPVSIPIESAQRTPRDVTVHVTGAVAKPGVYTIADGRIADAIEAAGGLVEGGDVSRLNLAARLRDGQQIVVPIAGGAAAPPLSSRATATRRPDPAASGAIAPATTSSASGPTPSDGSAQPSPVQRTARATLVPGARVNLNRATQAELEALPGIGAATATRILRYREEHGPFPSVDAFRRARLLPASVYERLQQQLEAP